LNRCSSVVTVSTNRFNTAILPVKKAFYRFRKIYLYVSVDFQHNQPLFTLQIPDNDPCNEDKICSLSGVNSVTEYKLELF